MLVTSLNCHPERSEGSVVRHEMQIRSGARDGKILQVKSLVKLTRQGLTFAASPVPAPDKSSTLRLPAPACGTSATLRIPLPDRISSHAPQSPRSIHAVTSIRPKPPKSAYTLPFFGKADRETQNPPPLRPLPIAARLFPPRPSRSGSHLQSPATANSQRSVPPLSWTTQRSKPKRPHGSAPQSPPRPSRRTNRARRFPSAPRDSLRIAR